MWKRLVHWSILCVIFVLFSSCAKKEARVLVGEKVVCEKCRETIKEDVSVEIMLRDSIESLDVYVRTAYRSERELFDFDAVKITRTLCDSCRTKQLRKKEEERREADRRKRKEVQMAKQVATSSWVETVALSPIDYLVHYTLENKTGSKIRVEYKVICENYKTPSGFFDFAEFSDAISPGRMNHYAWRPEDGIRELRQVILEKGSSLTTDDIASLGSGHFESEVELVDIKIME